MSQGDLIIIRDALKEAIKNQREVKLFTDESSFLFSQQQQKYIDKCLTDLMISQVNLQGLVNSL